jgi:RNA polymerase I-specific transcription initiation factor RRN3
MLAAIPSAAIASAIIGRVELSDASNHASLGVNADRESAHEDRERLLYDLGDDFSFELPKSELPPAKEFGPVEAFVHKTVVEQNQQANDNVPLKAYKGILEALRFKTDLSLVAKILLALRTSGKGSTLHLLASCPTKHARLIHHLVRFHPFEEPTTKAIPKEHTEEDDAKILAVADSHLHLLLALVSANSVYLLPTLSALWKLLALEYETVSTLR